MRNNILGVIAISDVSERIYFIKGFKVMFDHDLANLYGIQVKRLNEAVKRNAKRFPQDFMFQLTIEETMLHSRSQFATLNSEQKDNLKSQFATSSYGGKRKPSYVFTEQGVAMLSSVLNSDTAVQINIQIIRIFTKLREMVDSYKELREKIEILESKYDEHFKIVFQAIRNMIKEEENPREGIGFKPRD